MDLVIQTILEEILSQQPHNKAELNDIRRKVAGKLKTRQPSNIQLLTYYHILLKKKSIIKDETIETLLRKADIRSGSGIAVVASLIKPYACPGKCIYCPTEVKMPKSYIATEPAAARALALAFSPYEQMRRRILMLEKNGHPTEKIEYILKGGTWNAYPLKYQYWFLMESFKACNNLSRRIKKDSTEEKYWTKKTLTDLQTEMSIEQEYNDKKAKYKIIGLTLETRPDAISTKTIYHMRRQGCTRIELGLQAPDDKILTLIQRGHTVQQFRDAIFFLRQAGFKVDLHFMPDLPGTTATHDIDMYTSLFHDEGLKPDMVKIYPCTVIKSAELYQWYKTKKYKPYAEKDLFDALLEMKKTTPYYCRISRLIRDIPSTEIQAGNAITNLRENLKKTLHQQGFFCKCLRCREVSHAEKIHHIQAIDYTTQLFIETYTTIGGTEYFLSFEDKKRRIVYAFLRLRLPTYTDKIQKSLDLEKLLRLGNLDDTAFVRELHTYGQLVQVGSTDKDASQHKGLGKKLIREAEKIAQKNGFKKIAVISGVGVRDYYRKNGFSKRGEYMIKGL